MTISPSTGLGEPLADNWPERIHPGRQVEQINFQLVSQHSTELLNCGSSGRNSAELTNTCLQTAATRPESTPRRSIPKIKGKTLKLAELSPLDIVVVLGQVAQPKWSDKVHWADRRRPLISWKFNGTPVLAQPLFVSWHFASRKKKNGKYHIKEIFLRREEKLKWCIIAWCSLASMRVRFFFYSFWLARLLQLED